jgi:hypothetical protein
LGFHVDGLPFISKGSFGQRIRISQVSGFGYLEFSASQLPRDQYTLCRLVSREVLKS